MHQRDRGNRHARSLAGRHYFRFEFVRVSPPFAATQWGILVNSVHLSTYSLSGHDAPKAATSIQDAITDRLRAGDAPPGNTVVWHGMRRLTDIQPGYELALNRSG